jgi:hypothetical protein
MPSEAAAAATQVPRAQPAGRARGPLAGRLRPGAQPVGAAAAGGTAAVVEASSLVYGYGHTGS